MSGLLWSWRSWVVQELPFGRQLPCLNLAETLLVFLSHKVRGTCIQAQSRCLMAQDGPSLAPEMGALRSDVGLFFSSLLQYIHPRTDSPPLRQIFLCQQYERISPPLASQINPKKQCTLCKAEISHWEMLFLHFPHQLWKHIAIQALQNDS